ncbi:RNA-directed DNA polymerase from mobile element jockey [Trichonephila clavipes]|nr:RNA-directed DNA polymerase from mobile element jockey [Trichonephila clavipes]
MTNTKSKKDTATQTDIGTQTEISNIETPTNITNLTSESHKDSPIAQKSITNNLIEQETNLSPSETSSTDLESLNIDKRSSETSHLSVPSDTEVLMEIDKSSTKRPATDIVQEAAKILKPSIRTESGGIQTTKEVEDVKLLMELSWSLEKLRRFKIAYECEHLPVCVALQETLLKPSCTYNIRGYSILRKEGDRACGGVALLINHATPCCPVLIRTSIQAVAVQVSIFSTVTICNVYLPTNAPLNFRELQELIDQLPSPFILLGDFNAHHLLWGCQDVNSRGKVVEKLLTELDLTLLNDGSYTYFHSPTQSFSAIDLSICSPSVAHTGIFQGEVRGRKFTLLVSCSV